MLKINTQKRTYKILIFGLVVITLSAAAFGVYSLLKTKNNASAYLDGFDPGNIMSDFVMGNKNTMTEAQIDDFLHSKNPCNRAYDDEVRYYESQGYHYSIKDNRVLCMADDTFNGKSIAKIIWQAAQDYSINPQVLIVLLEKEQSLVTDPWPNDRQYAKATGFGCPDTSSGCDPAYSGLETQIRKAASLFREVLDGGWSNYPAYTTQFIYYNPSASCGGSNIYIQNRATSALYRYTPYQPNAAALAAGKGTGDSCSSYGNRNFYNLFTEWFGNTRVQSSNIVLPNGTYEIASSNNVVLDVSNAGKSDGTNVQVWEDNNTSAQRWQLARQSDGSYKIKNINSNKYLDVSNAGTRDGSNVQIWNNNNTCAQKWNIVTSGDGYRLVSACSGNSLDISNGTIRSSSNVQIWNNNDTAAQRWYLKKVDDQSTISSSGYIIKSSGNKALDIRDGHIANGTSAQIWDPNSTNAQQWFISPTGDGLYAIMNPASLKYLDASNSGTNDGTKVQIWDRAANNTCAQKWNITKNGDGYRITSSCSGKSLDIFDGKIISGSSVQIWNNNDTAAQRWYLEPSNIVLPNGTYEIASSNNVVLDVSNAGKSDGTNVQVWEDNNTSAQRWQLARQSDGSYKIKNINSNKYLDVSNAGTRDGSNVQIWNNNNTCAQKWNIVTSGDGYRLVSACSGNSLDISNGTIRSSSNVQIWNNNDTAAQRWYLKKVN